jgi:menaquinone reductase, molybdopterin-binding-like subunit
VGAHTNGTEALAAILGLNLIAGNVGKPGGVLLNSPGPLRDVPAFTSPSPLNDWAKLADSLRAGQVAAVLVHDANPAYELPAALGFHDALRNAPFVASFSSFPDETTMLADVVLPSNLPLEDWGDDPVEPAPGYPVVTIRQPIVSPLYDTRSFWDVLLGLGQSLGLSLPWPSIKDAVHGDAQTLRQTGRGNVTGGDDERFWVDLRQKGGWWDDGSRVAGGQSPQVQGLRWTAAEFAGSEQEYPDYLAPFEHNTLGDGRGANQPWLQATPDPATTAVWRTWVEINPKRAVQLGVKEGDLLRISTPAGSAEVPAYVSPAAPPNVLAMPLGQGHTAYGRYAENRGVNPLSLLAPIADSATGALAYAATRARIEKTGRSVQLPKFEGDVPAYQIQGKEVLKVAYGAS